MINYTDTQKAEILSLYASGVSPNEIAERFDCSSAHVRKVVRRWGGEIRAHGGARTPKRKHSLTADLCQTRKRNNGAAEADDKPIGFTKEERAKIKSFCI